MTALNLARRHRLFLVVVGFCSILLLLLVTRIDRAAAAACTAPATDYGTVSNLSVNVSASGTYRVWTRMAAADTTNNTYLLEIDGSNCYTVGGSGVPVYASGATTYFVSGSSNWISKTSSGTQIDVNLTAGTHTLKLIGNAPNVVVDRVVMTQDTACVPSGTGDNCANPPDTTAPVASITSPANNASISGTVTVSVNATDDSGVVSKVELYIDGAGTANQTDSSSPFSFSVTGLTVGTHSFVVKAYDAAGNVGTSSTVTITSLDSSPPTVSITSPAAGSTQSGTFMASATASDNVGVTKVEFYLDGTLKTTDTTGPSPFSGSIDVSAITGTHSLTAKAYDAAGNSTTSGSVSITVTAPAGGDTTPPTVSITAPPSGAILSDDLNNANFNSAAYGLVATASDASGIKQVVFKIDGTAIGTADTAAPYTATLDLTKLTCGTHTVTATATDNATTPNSATASATFTATYSADITATPDCHVTYLDLSALAAKYNQSSGVGRADINKDGTVNYLDLSALAAKYGK